MIQRLPWLLILVALTTSTAHSKGTELLDQSYGKNRAETFDLWIPESKGPVPLVIFIHGGGWVAGDKNEMRTYPKTISRFLSRGFALASINYRFLKVAPLQEIMREDIGGFVQFMRGNAQKYKIDPKRVFSYGASAGASASLWLATHDDLADPSASDPLRRESTRILAAGHLNGQFTYDFLRWYECFGEELTDRFLGAQVYSRYHLHSKADLKTPEGEAIRKDLDSYGNMDSSDAPLYLWSSLEDDLGRDANHFLHAPEHARLLQARAEETGVKAKASIKADGSGTADPHKQVLEFFESVMNP
jgi:hypothetical protein